MGRQRTRIDGICPAILAASCFMMLFEMLGLLQGFSNCFAFLSWIAPPAAAAAAAAAGCSWQTMDNPSISGF